MNVIKHVILCNNLDYSYFLLKVYSKKLETRRRHVSV